MLLALAVAFFAAAAPRAAEPPVPAPSLYVRLGGVNVIAAIVDDLVERSFSNAVLNANPAIAEARKHEPKAGVKYHLTSLLCWASGGPEAYTGRPMKDAHAHLNISGKEWKAFVDDCRASLDKFKVPQPEQKELLAIIESTKADIVADAKGAH